MASQENTSLCFVSWNINGIKNTNKHRRKFLDALELLSSFSADIVFLQETHVGAECVDKHLKPYCSLENRDETGKEWKIFFTVYNSDRKGVAILIRNSVPFEYICHDEDCSGGYIVLFCYLYGELYTLVNVYNHKDDQIILGRLKEYLMETAEGVLVVGGDFNTVLDPQVDRKSFKSKSKSNKDPLLDVLKDFIKSLRIKDAWSNTDNVTDSENRFTRKQKDSMSRLDMFFLQDGERVCEIKVGTNCIKYKNISDHYPLLLKLTIQMRTPTVTTVLKKSERRSYWTPGKISGAEIVSAMKSLPVREVHSPITIRALPRETKRKMLRSQIKTLTTKYNDILSSPQVPDNFKCSKDTVYLIFTEILAKRLKAFLSLEEKYDSVITVNFDRNPQKISWSFMEIIFQRLDKLYKENCAAFVPEPKFSILDDLLLKTESSSTDLRDLQPGCPLTNAILSLALDQLDLEVKEKATCETTVCYHKHSLTIHTHESSQKEILEVIKRFQEKSGLLLKLAQV